MDSSCDVSKLYPLQHHVLFTDVLVHHRDMKRNGDEMWQAVAWRNFFRSHGMRNTRDYTFANMIRTDGVAVTALFTRDKTPAERKRPSKAQLQAMEAQRKGAVLESPYERRFIFIDPGRTCLITAMEKLDGGGERWWKLTRRGYYASFRHGIDRLKKINADLAHVDAQFSATSLKGTLAQFMDYIR